MTDTKTTGFTLLRSQEVPLLQATVYEFEHPTGAKLLHFACADEENAFAAIMPTVPTNESGAPHILEHCLFSGSKHYPDTASRGATLATGGGAWTGWEYTWYFMASPRHPDFLKRIDIWCDSLFEPLLEKETFEYQAHHLEFEDPEDPSTDLRYRGVIYNEQKGILGHPIAVSWTAVCRALFPNHPYSLEHGGTPRGVPTITYEQLKAFHERHYHPANAHFLTWGDVPLDDLLATFDAALSRVPERPFTATPYPPIEPLPAPVRGSHNIPIGANEDPSGRAMVIMAWVTAPAEDPYESLLHDLLVELLMGTPTAPLRAALASSGLGKAVAETYDKYGIRFLRHTTAAGLQDTDPDKADAIEQVIMSTLERVASEGFPDGTIDAALNKLEFARRTLAGPQGDEGSPTSFWIRHINTPWLAGGDPLEILNMDLQLERLAKEREGGRPVEERLRAWFIDNPFRALVTVVPDPGADLRLEDVEREELAALKAAMSDKEKQAVVANTRHLREHLESRSAPPLVPEGSAKQSAPVAPIDLARGLGYATRTNGITYVEYLIDVGSLPDELWDYLRLYSLAVVRSGGDAIQSRIGVATGGVSSDVRVPVCERGEKHRRLLRIGGRALERHQDELVSLLTSLHSATIEKSALDAVADSALAHAEQQVFIDAPGYLRRLAGSHLRASWGLRDRLDGFGQLATLRSLRTNHDALERVRAVAEHVRTVDLQLFVAAASEEAIGKLDLGSVPGGATRTGSLPDLVDAPIQHEARTFGQPTAFNCEVFRTDSRPGPDAAAILVAGSVASSWVRADVVRNGTAYSGAVDAFSDPGSLVCWSIRDPNIVRTYESFESAMRRLGDGAIDDQELRMAKLEASLAWRMPETPARDAFRAFVAFQGAGFGPGAYEPFYAAIEAVTSDDVARVASRSLTEPGAKASLTSAEMAEQAGLFDAIREV
jgi:Zn-dependent M16 (insulinase) family peptidase